MRYTTLAIIRFYLCSLAFSAQAYLLRLSDHHKIYISSDEGQTWSPHPLSTTHPHISFLDIAYRTNK